MRLSFIQITVMQNTDKYNRPESVRPEIGNIPAELQELPQWVLWRYEWKDETGAWAKVPYSADGYRADSTNPERWSDFKTIISVWTSNENRYDGIGFVFNEETGIIGIDLDNCLTVEVDEDGIERYKATPFANRVLSLCPSYTELSPSKTGLHIIGKAQITRAVKSSKYPIEVYAKARYFTFTGATYNVSNSIHSVQSGVDKILSGLANKQANTKQTQEERAVLEPTSTVLASERLEMAFNSKNGSQIRALYDGDTAMYGSDDSAADMALCSYLAFWSENNPSLLDEMFRSSGLYRAKWDKRHSSDGKTYGEMTIERALSSCAEFYNPNRTVEKLSDRAITPEPSLVEIRARLFEFGSLYRRADEFRRNPVTLGESTGWDALNPFYRPKTGEFTVVTGAPNSGKSTWLDQLCFNLAVASDWKILFVSFETQPIEKHANKLARLYCQRPTYKWIHDAASDEEFRQAFENLKDKFILSHIPREHRTVEGILEYAKVAIQDYGIKGFVFDPFSSLTPPKRLVSNYTHFVQDSLNAITDFTQDNNIHTWLVAHPAKYLVKGQSSGKPTLYDIADSSHFYNKCDYGIVVHRPSFDTNETHICVDKVRDEDGTIKGQCSLFYNRSTGWLEEGEWHLKMVNAGELAKEGVNF